MADEKDAATFFANICKLSDLHRKVVKNVLITNFGVLFASACVWTNFSKKNFCDKDFVVLIDTYLLKSLHKQLENLGAINTSLLFDACEFSEHLQYWPLIYTIFFKKRSTDIDWACVGAGSPTNYGNIL